MVPDPVALFARRTRGADLVVPKLALIRVCLVHTKIKSLVEIETM